MDLPEPKYEIGCIDDDWIARAQRHGIQVLKPKPNELFIDLDTNEDWDDLFALRDALDKRTGIYAGLVKVWPSQSGFPHRHAIMDVGFDLTPEFRIFLQMYLGSDKNREIRSMRDVMKGAKYPTVFIEGKWKDVEVLPYPGTTSYTI